jgi:hypothetical protein
VTFSSKVEIYPFVIAAEDGQLFLYLPGGEGTSELLETAIPKLVHILGAARLAANRS